MTPPLPTQPEEVEIAVRGYNRVMEKYFEWMEEYRNFYHEYPKNVWMLPDGL